MLPKKQAPTPLRTALAAILAAVVVQVSAIAPARADEAPAAPAQPSFLQRYTSNVQELIIKGLEFVGVRYRRGGTDPETGMDCSGFVRLVFQESLGFTLPRTALAMASVGEHIEQNELKPGDLVFFNTMRRAFSHVGIYVGNNQFVHSPRPGGEVRVEDMRQGYWVKRYNGARRIIENNPS